MDQLRWELNPSFAAPELGDQIRERRRDSDLVVAPRKGVTAPRVRLVECPGPLDTSNGTVEAVGDLDHIAPPTRLMLTLEVLPGRPAIHYPLAGAGRGRTDDPKFGSVSDGSRRGSQP